MIWIVTFPGCVLPLLEEQEVPLLRRVTRQAQRADRRQRGPAHREKVILMTEALKFNRSPTIFMALFVDTWLVGDFLTSIILNDRGA